MEFLTSSGNILYIIAAFVVALSIIVAVHEYGHYIVGRWCGIGADVFSIGMGPVLWSRMDKRGTKWQVAALPFGGYVKFKCDENAASVGGTKGGRDTMLGAPLWARAATVSAGPLFNFALSILVFAAVILFRGQATEPLTVNEVYPLPDIVQELQSGDQVLAIAGIEAPAFEEFDGFVDSLPLGEVLDYRVLRDGEEVTVQGPYPYPARVISLTPRSAAFDAGMKLGDVIMTVDGTAIHSFEDLRELVGASDGRTLALEVWRDGEILPFNLTPKQTDLPGENGFETRYLIGINGGLFFDPVSESPGFLGAISRGLNHTWYIIVNSLTGLWSIISGAISTCNLSGPIGIGETAGAMASQGTTSFIWFVAVLSTAVGLLNLFPVPVLDGGHLVFHAYEAVSGRPPSDNALRVLMSIGIALIGTLMLFAIYNDLAC